MKHLIVLAVIVTVAYGLDPEFIAKAKEKMQQIATECMAETGVSADEIAQMKAKQAPSTKEGKCFIACFQKHLGVLNADGKLDKAGAIAKLDMFKEADVDLYGKVVQMMDECYAAVPDEADPCDTALNFVICLHNAKEKMGVQCELFD